MLYLYTIYSSAFLFASQTHTHTHTQCKGANCWQKRANSLEWFTDGLTGATTPPPQQQQQQQQQQYRKHVALENSSPISAYQYISLCGTVYIVSMDTKGHGTRKERATTTSREKERKKDTSSCDHSLVTLCTFQHRKRLSTLDVLFPFL